jgi:hypothetical protein
MTLGGALVAPPTDPVIQQGLARGRAHVRHGATRPGAFALRFVAETRRFHDESSRVFEYGHVVGAS